MMYWITLGGAVAFAAWLINKGLHWWDDVLEEYDIDPLDLE